MKSETFGLATLEAEVTHISKDGSLVVTEKQGPLSALRDVSLVQNAAVSGILNLQLVDSQHLSIGPILI